MRRVSRPTRRPSGSLSRRDEIRIVGGDSALYKGQHKDVAVLVEWFENMFDSEFELLDTTLTITQSYKGLVGQDKWRFDFESPKDRTRGWISFFVNSEYDCSDERCSHSKLKFGDVYASSSNTRPQVIGPQVRKWTWECLMDFAREVGLPEYYGHDPATF